MNKNQAVAYGAITLDLLYKMKVKITPEIFAKQMNLICDLYNLDEIETEYNNVIENNKILEQGISGRANCYIVNIFNSVKQQKEMIKRFSGGNVKLGRIYITPPGENSDKYYELIKDIRNKNMDLLIMTVFTILGMSQEERDVIVKLCRKNDIILIEIWEVK